MRPLAGARWSAAGTLAAVWGALPAAFAVLALAGVAAQLAVAAGVIAALFHRRKEIRGGEEDEAKKY